MTQYDVALKPGTDATAYAAAVGRALGQNYQTSVQSDSSPQLLAVLGLIGALMLLLAAVAGLGVLNTVVLQTRERVHDFGVFKAVGMTPRQTMAMVICSVAGTGLAAGLIAIPAGIALHHYVLPVMGHAAQTAVPASVLHVYQPWELVLLALSGLLIAVAGALAPPAGPPAPHRHRPPAEWRALHLAPSRAPDARRRGRASLQPPGPDWLPAPLAHPVRPPSSRPSAASTAATCSRAPRAGRRRAAARKPASRPRDRARRRSRPRWPPPPAPRTPAPAPPPAPAPAGLFLQPLAPPFLLQPLPHPATFSLGHSRPAS